METIMLAVVMGVMLVSLLVVMARGIKSEKKKVDMVAKTTKVKPQKGIEKRPTLRVVEKSKSGRNFYNVKIK